MVEEKEPVKEVNRQELSTRRSFLNKCLFVVTLFIILFGISASGIYWWRDKIATDSENKQATTISTLQKTISSLSTRLKEEKAKNATDSTSSDTDTDSNSCTPVAPAYSVLENIQASITSGNTAALEGYMASSVNVILAATEAYGPQTPTQAVGDITDFISGESGWDFSLPASVLSSYGKGGYGQYFTNIDVVGKSANSKVISFLFDCNSKISTVLLVSNEDLLQ